MINLIANMIKAAFTVYNGRKSVTLQSNNMYTTGYNLDKIYTVTPYGQFAIPNDNVNSVIMRINNSPKGLISNGFIQSLPSNSPINITTGEFCFASNNWALTWNNDGLRANKLDNSNYLATLISGEWVNKIFTDIITRLDQIETLYNEHTHTAGDYIADSNPVTGDSGTVVIPMPDDDDLINDQTAINNENDLLNDSAIPIP